MGKIKEVFSKYRSEILVGVVVWLITTILHCFVNWLSTAAPVASNTLIKFISDSFYHRVASHSSASLMHLMFGMAFGAYIGYLGFVVSQGLTESTKNLKLSKQIINNTSEKCKIEKSKYIDFDDTISLDVYKKQLLRKAKSVRLQMIAFASFVILYSLWIVIFNIVPSIIWHTYSRDIIKISPYIDQHELQIIQSDWVCMQEKRDFDNIYARINAIKEVHNLP